MDDWSTSAPARLAVSEPAPDRKSPVTATLTRPAPSWMTVHPQLQGGHSMATKDKNTKKSMEKKPAQKTLKEKRQAKRAKK
jgi:hypothetical protein